MKTVMNDRFDLTGSEISRLGKHWILSMLAKYEDFSGGPGFKFLLIALIIHYLGGPLAWLLIRFENRTVRLLTFFRRGTF